MNTIVVPTDFSPSADNAMNYAAQLAQIIGASILLVHVYQIPISMNDVPVLMVSAEELKNSADQGLARAKEIINKTSAGLEVKTESRLGDVIEEVNDVCASAQPFAIILGKHGASGVERLLFGSTTLSMIRHSKFPVIAVPDIVSSLRTLNIALAVENGSFHSRENWIETFIRLTKAQLHVIYVHEAGKDAPMLKNAFIDFNPVYKTIRNEEFLRSIESYVHSHAIDALIVLPHQHSFIERLFSRTHTAELIQKLNIPIITLSLNE